MYTAPTLRSACSLSRIRPAMSGVEGASPRPFSWGCKGDILFREREYPPLSRSHTVWGTTMQRCRAAIKTPLRGRAQKKAAFRLPIFSVHRAHEGRRSLLKSHIQLHAVRAHIARGIFIGMPVLGRGAALMEKRRRAGRAVQKLRLVRREHDGLIRVRRGKRDDADVVEEAVKAVRLQKLARQVRIDVLAARRRRFARA